MGSDLLEIRNLVTSFTDGRQRVVAVDEVCLSLEAGQTLALVGESGCGKSALALSVLRLLQEPPARIERGEIHFEGIDLLKIDEPRLRRIRGDRIAMIFQEPMTSLNPVFTIGFQLVETIKIHRDLSAREAWARAIEMLELAGIPAAHERMGAYPHQFSGGMLQRVMIAMALSCDPKLLIADEPTTALDVTVQAQLLQLLRSLQERQGMSILFITHDLGIVAEFAQRVAVMYAGRIVEECSVDELFRAPQHPYTAGLLASVPGRVLAQSATPPPRRLPTIEGGVPSLTSLPSGCRFRNRCGRLRDPQRDAMRCASVEPMMIQSSTLHRVRCHFPLSLEHCGAVQ